MITFNSKDLNGDESNLNSSYQNTFKAEENINNYNSNSTTKNNSTENFQTLEKTPLISTELQKV